MKQSLACVWLLGMSVACSANGGPTTSARGTGGASGSGGAHPAAGSAGVSSGGTSSSAGSGTGGTGGANTAGGSANGGSAGAATAGGAAGSGGAGGAAATAFKCPAGPFDAPMLTNAKAEHIAGAPPNDAFNMNNFTNVEGPVWIGDSLYFSEMTGSNMIPPARILKIAPGNVVSVADPDSGSNGLAVDGQGNLVAAVHKDGSISRIALPGGAATPLVSEYLGKRFISPNDLAIRSDGTIYFSDPNFQNMVMPAPQSAQNLYWVTTTGGVSPVAGAPSQPNGVTLSPDEMTLYVSGNGLKKFPVMAGGGLGTGTDFVVGSGGDGMAVDCAGNLYVAGNMGNIVRVYSPTATLLGTIMADNGGTTTNVAFGGPDHKTLYITAQGNDGQRGVFSIALNVPGFPY